VLYTENFEIFCSVVNEPDIDGAFSIAILQEVFESNELKM
jgi:hypothetical protein